MRTFNDSFNTLNSCLTYECYELYISCINIYCPTRFRNAQFHLYDKCMSDALLLDVVMPNA